MLHDDIFLSKQLIQCVCDLRARERFRDQQDSSRIPGAQARVGLVRGVTDDDDGKPGVIRMIANQLSKSDSLIS